MRTINIYSNGSPIHSRTIEYLLGQSTADENIVINYRGMRMTTIRKVTGFYCKNEEYLNERSHVKSIFDYINTNNEGDVRINLYIAHSNYLICKVHSALRLGSYSYIEDGIGTYAALIDASKGTEYFASAMSTDVTRSIRKTLRELILSNLPDFFRSWALIFAKRTWTSQRMLSMNLFAIALRKNDVFFDWIGAEYHNVYLAISKFPALKSFQVPLVISPPKIRADRRYLVLIPPQKIIGVKYFDRFVDALLGLRNTKIDFQLDYKSHPSDTEGIDYKSIIAKNRDLRGELLTFSSNNETAIVAYEMGYKGLICYDSSATLYAMSFLPPSEFECIDLCEVITGREPYGVTLANELMRF